MGVDVFLGVGLQNACWAAMLALAAGIGASVFRSRPGVAHALWLLVLLKLVTPSLLLLDVLGPHNSPQEITARGGPGMRAASSPAVDFAAHPAGEQRGNLVESNQRGVEAVSARLAPAEDLFSARQRSQQPMSRYAALPWKEALISLWLVGAAICWSTIALSSHRFGRLLRCVPIAPDELRAQVRQIGVRLGLKRIPHVWIVPVRIPPMIWAALVGRPRLLLPQELWRQLSHVQKDAILAHELAHLKRRDHWVRRLETIVIGLYWWFPITWWARRELEQAEEMCCDAWVLETMPGAADSYALALVATATFVSGYEPLLPLGATGAGRMITIKRRLNMILCDASRVSIARSAPAGLLFLGAICLPLLPGLAVGQSGRDSKQSPVPARRAEKQAQAIAAPVQNTAPKSEPNLLEDAVSEAFNAQRKVRVCQAIEREISDQSDFFGEVEAEQTVLLRPRVSGYLLRVFFHPGQVVKAGEMLFEIDSRPYRAEVDRAMAEVQRAEARVRASAKELKRRQEQVKENVAGPASAAAVEGKLAEDEAALKAAQASLQIAKLNLDFTRVTAPIAGTISEPRLSPGNVAVADRTELATITSLDPMYVYFSVAESFLLYLAREKRAGKLKSGLEPGMQVRVGLADEQDFPREGKVRFVDNHVFRETASFRCCAAVPNLDGFMLPGMSAKVRLETSAPRKSVLVPARGIVRQGGQNPRLCVVASNGVIQVRQINVGSTHDDLTVVAGGVRAGEWIAIEPGTAENLAGQKVEPEFLPWPLPDSVLKKKGRPR
jgi:RND family efflux transporter MFP subunit